MVGVDIRFRLDIKKYLQKNYVYNFCLSVKKISRFKSQETEKGLYSKAIYLKAEWKQSNATLCLAIFEYPEKNNVFK